MYIWVYRGKIHREPLGANFILLCSKGTVLKTSEDWHLHLKFNSMTLAIRTDQNVKHDVLLAVLNKIYLERYVCVYRLWESSPLNSVLNVSYSVRIYPITQLRYWLDYNFPKCCNTSTVREQNWNLLYSCLKINLNQGWNTSSEFSKVEQYPDAEKEN